MSVVFFSLTFVSVLAYAIVAGCFLAFSDFIMRSLGRTEGQGGIQAMQTINKEVFRWVFMTLFIGLTPVSLIIAIYGGVFVGSLPGMIMAAAGLVYVLGCFGVTALCNVPMNEALAKMDASDHVTNEYWSQTYLPKWTQWNTIRTIACILSSALLLLGLLSAELYQV